MTVSYLRGNGGKAERAGAAWNLTWPDGSTLADVVFTTRTAESAATTNQLTLEAARVRDLTTRFPRVRVDEPIPDLGVPSLPAAVTGFWSLWRITLRATVHERQRIMPLFVHDNERVFGPTARRVWEVLLTETFAPTSWRRGAEAAAIFARIQTVAEVQGRVMYDTLLGEHRAWLAREAAKTEYAFAARLKAIERIGLPAVRAHRIGLLDDERQGWRMKHDEMSRTSPDLEPLLLIHVAGGAAGG